MLKETEVNVILYVLIYLIDNVLKKMFFGGWVLRKKNLTNQNIKEYLNCHVAFRFLAFVSQQVYPKQLAKHLDLQ